MVSHSDMPDRIVRSPSPAVSQAAAILRLLVRAGEPLGVTAIAQATGISQSSCFNLLKTLVAEDFVQFDAALKRYVIGLGVLQLARGALGADAIQRAARPLMSALSDEYEATVGLWRVDGRRRMTLVGLGESSASTRIHMEVGQRQPLGAGAAGRAWLSATICTSAEREALFAEVRWQQPVTFAAYEASIDAARIRGFAEDCEFLNRGIITVASPICARSGMGEVLHVLSASAFAGSRDAASREVLGRAIVAGAEQLASHADPNLKSAPSGG